MSLVLILEDSRPMAEAAAEALTGAGHEALIALSVTEAVIAVQERRPDLVLTEYLVAETTGLEFLEQLKRLENPPPVVMATGLGEEDAAARVLALGAWSYVLKTESYIRELPALVERFLAEAEARKKDLERHRLQGRRAAQNEMAGWLDHNFKNILAASLGFLNLINFNNPDQDPAKREEFLAESRKLQETAVKLLEQLTRLTDAEVEVEAERFSMSEVLEEAWAAASQAVLIGIECQSPDDTPQAQTVIKEVSLVNAVRRLPPLNFVRNDLKAILVALLQNALESSLKVDAPRILVAGDIHNQQLELTVRDNGQGMSEDVMRRAREPLFSTKGEVGVGLGLSLTDALVERHGGTMEFKSAPGEGLMVRITLPLERQII
ncbi:MAG: hybrid sensor histidine kinase/response regulator [Deltaproteobacteria bacterium]|nr:hybrid sensor histidine kinase/response regulator [Deltaproteobacteria bacterium]